MITQELCSLPFLQSTFVSINFDNILIMLIFISLKIPWSLNNKWLDVYNNFTLQIQNYWYLLFSQSLKTSGATIITTHTRRHGNLQLHITYIIHTNNIQTGVTHLIHINLSVHTNQVLLTLRAHMNQNFLAIALHRCWMASLQIKGGLQSHLLATVAPSPMIITNIRLVYHILTSLE